MDEHFIQAMFMKNVMGPVTALVNQSLPGYPVHKRADRLHPVSAAAIEPEQGGQEGFRS